MDRPLPACGLQSHSGLSGPLSVSPRVLTVLASGCPGSVPVIASLLGPGLSPAAEGEAWEMRVARQPQGLGGCACLLQVSFPGAGRGVTLHHYLGLTWPCRGALGLQLAQNPTGKVSALGAHVYAPTLGAQLPSSLGNLSSTTSELSETLKTVSLCHAGQLGPCSMGECGSGWGWTVLSKPPQTGSWPSLCSWAEQDLSRLRPFFLPDSLAILPVDRCCWT